MNSNTKEQQNEHTEPHLLKVSSKSSPASVAGAIAGMIKDGKAVEIQSVGAGAVNQAVKSMAISRSFLLPVGIELSCVPAFIDIVINGENRTAIRFTIKPHRILHPDLTIKPDTELKSSQPINSTKKEENF